MISAEHQAVPAQDMTHVGPYRLVSKLGRGATSQVYLALDEQGNSVTIKLLPAAAVSEAARARSDAEATILSSLDHPGLPRLIDKGITEGLPIDIPYLVTQYIHGLSLDEYAAANRPDDKAILKLVADICGPLQYLHDRGILHRDLKPSNIIITSDRRPVIIDFGYATSIASSALNESPPLRTVGTTRYASPEAITASAPEGPPTDIYALAVVSYELLTAGRWPYPETDQAIDERQVIESVLPSRPSSFRPDLKGPLDEIFDCALAKDPRRRYTSASAFAVDLNNYLASRPIHACSLSLREQAIHHWKHAWQLILVIALLVSIATTATLGWLAAHERATKLQLVERRASELLISSELLTPEGRSRIGTEIEDWDTQLVQSIYEAMGNRAREDKLFNESLLWFERARQWVIENRAQRTQFLLRADQLICETMVMAARPAEAEARLRDTIAQYASEPKDAPGHGKIIRNRILRLYWSLGIALEKQGRLQEAEDLLTEILALQIAHMHPDHTDINETLTVLERVRQKIASNDQ